MRLARPRGQDDQLLRRSYHFAEGIRKVTGTVRVKAEPITGQQDAGMLFLAYEQDP